MSLDSQAAQATARSSQPRLLRRPTHDHDDAEALALCSLIESVWPRPGSSARLHFASFRGRWTDEGREVLSVWAGAKPLAMAMIFPREVMTPAGPLRVMALAAVCSDPTRRGEGWGRMVARAALAEVRPDGYTLSLFQTGIPTFYEKLGSRVVDNAFINSRHQPGDRGGREQPWWNPFVMIHPAGSDWPDGTVDLLGPGY